MQTKDFYFDLPEELIAQKPLLERDSSKMMVLNRKTGEIDHKIFKNIVDYFKSGDVLVLNDTRVLPARLIGEKIETKGKMEFLLLKRIELNKWQVMVKPGKRAQIGSQFSFGDGKLIAQVIELAEEGTRIVEFSYEGIFEEVLDNLGNMPLPPYITERLEDKERYQTVFSKHTGSSAAPTAGLHFTKEIIKKLEKKGVEVVYITLHVGLGTFRPVKVEDLLNHKMHSEFCHIEKEVADLINKAKKENRRVTAVGTTSIRTLESFANKEGYLDSGHKWTEIFIYPGYEFKIVDRLLTNFHLPESTLIMLVSAFSKKEFILNAYKNAVDEKYRFFSFGDCMFLTQD